MPFKYVSAVLTFNSLLLLAACGGGSSESAPPSEITDTGDVTVQDSGSTLPAQWARKSVFMEIYVRGYRDSDGDGIGDLNGVTESLDYLQDLGIGGIWLMPITASSDRDHGYATQDYRDIESDYGTLEDLQNLITAAHARDIGIIMDYVINHSSSVHPIFENARSSSSNEYRDWYIWKNSKPSGWSNWGGLDVWHNSSSGYYYGVFTGSMPDFNWENEAVTTFHENNLRYWLNLGLDGFRFDAVGVLVENGSNAWENQDENHPILVNVQNVLKDYENRHMVCESPSAPHEFSSVNSCATAFAFYLQYYINSSAKNGTVSDDMMDYINSYRLANMSPILANHDTFAGERLYNQFAGDIAQYKVAAATLLTLPGAPFIYYGEEIGMSHSTNSGDNDLDHRLRGPMSWTGNTQNAGFSSDNSPFRRPADNVSNFNVEDQQNDADSLLNWYKSLISLRNAQPALSLGTYQALASGNGDVLAMRRDYHGDVLYVLINYGTDNATVNIETDILDTEFTALFPSTETNVITSNDGTLSTSLDAQSLKVFKTSVDGLDSYANTPLYWRGEINNWTATAEYQLEHISDHQYQLNVSLEAGDTLFKVADEDWGRFNFGIAQGKTLTLNTWQVIEYAPDAGDDLKLTLTESGIYLLELDATDPMKPSLRISKTP